MGVKRCKQLLEEYLQCRGDICRLSGRVSKVPGEGHTSGRTQRGKRGVRWSPLPAPGRGRGSGAPPAACRTEVSCRRGGGLLLGTGQPLESPGTAATAL